MHKFTTLVECKQNTNQADSPESRIQLASAVVMFEVIKIDDYVHHLEIEELINIFKYRFALNADEIGYLLEQTGSATNQELGGFINKIRDSWNYPDRYHLLKNIWAIAIADKIIDARETHMIHQIATKLNIEEADIIRAEKNATQALHRPD